MNFLIFGLSQKLTLWVSLGVDGFNKPIFAAPVERICRWEERSDRIQTAEGTEVYSRATIFLDQDLALGDYVKLGSHAGANPLQIPGAYRVVDFRKIPSIDGNFFERRAYL